MQGSLGSIFIDVAANTAKFESDLGRARRIAEQQSKAIQKGFEDAAERIFVAFETYKVVDHLVESLKQATEQMDALNKASQKTAIGVESLSELKYAASLADVQFESLTSGLQKFNKAIVEGRNGGKDQIAAFNALGISVEDLKKLSTDEILDRVATGFANAKDSADKTAISMVLFGKSGADLIPLLNEGAKGLAEAADEAHKFGVAISKDAAQAAEEFNDNITRLETQAHGLANEISSNLIEVMADLTNQLIAYNKESLNAKDAGALLADGIKQIALGGAIVGESIYGVIKLFSALAGSVEVVLADLTLFGKFLAHGGPAGLALESNRKEMAAALEERNKTLEEANARYVDLINYNGTAASDALRAAYAKQAGVKPYNPLDGINAVLHPNVVPFSSAFTPQIPFAPGRDATGPKGDLHFGAAADAQAKQQTEAEKLIQSLTRQLALYGDLTEEQKVQISLAEGYYGKVTPAQAKDLENLAQQLDLKKLISAYDKQEIDDESKRIATQQKQHDDQLRRAEQLANQTIKKQIGPSDIAANPFDSASLTAQATAQEEKNYRDKLSLFEQNQNELVQAGYDYNALVEQAAQEHQLKLNAIDKAGVEARTKLVQSGLQVANNVFGALGDLQDKSTKEGFERYKKFAIAQAIISTIQGAIGAFGQTAAAFPAPYGLIAGAVAAAAVVASGYAQISQIRSQQFAGRANGGPVDAGGMYEVGERNNPELLKYGGKTFLMMGNQGGSVSPAKLGRAANDASGNVNVTVEVHGSNGPATATATQTDTGTLIRLAVNGAQAAIQKDVANGGPTARLIQQTYSLQRSGR